MQSFIINYIIIQFQYALCVGFYSVVLLYVHKSVVSVWTGAITIFYSKKAFLIYKHADNFISDIL